jgi:NAD(P)-dependent dehydrogenase (short-subunit alcohol dehydrogenase family)
MSTVTVVTGANSGIGRAIAVHLAKQGHDVYGTVRDVGRAKKLQMMAEAAGVEVHLVALDVADDESVTRGLQEVLDEAGRVDVLVNNAGVGGNATVEDCSPAAMLAVMNVNLCGALRCIRHLAPQMRERGSGTIVNITSATGKFVSVAQAPYVASKWAFEGMSEELAFELAPFGIRVVIIEPGVTKSAIFAKNIDVPGGSDAYEPAYRRMLEFYAAGIPVATDPFEVAELIDHAIMTDSPQLRYACSWGGRELIEGRSNLSDEAFVALGGGIEGDGYWGSFSEAFGFEIGLPEG